MYRNHIFFFIPLFLFLFASPTFGQGQRQAFQEITLSKEDSIIASSIPELKLPEHYKDGSRTELPSELNNAELPYFRSIFSQQAASCGQASGIGYNFTYEINCARNLSASDSNNQYPTQFAYNFMNGGSGWRGVSYFHSFDLLKACGTPSVATYGGMGEGGDQRWMSGYDNYYSAMQNRVEEVFYIDVRNPEGLMTLKHWLNDHLNDSEFGGVASFYASSPYALRAIPPESPEAGKAIMIRWNWPASHAMTIVGYNDSIRFDWNQDGQFTNNIDINDDGLVNMKDWEYGALLFANSHGENFADSGYCYMMYRTLADEYGSGGIWNSAVHVLTVKETYTPKLTIRVKLNYNSREKIKILAGVSTDTASFSPTFSMDFPLLNYQGGNFPMQGPASDTLAGVMEIMEIELDVTPLLGYTEPNQAARFFFQLAENDPDNRGFGEILYFSLIDRTDNAIEIIHPETPMNITNNGITSLSLVKSVSFEKTRITTEELPAYTGEGNYTLTLEASGGQKPYQWDLLEPYSMNTIQKDFPEDEGTLINFNNQDVGHVDFDLAFPFPYYGDTMHQVSVALDGLLSFENDEFAYPYYYGETTMLTDRKVIAPFMANLWIDYNKDNGVWVENTAEYFGVRWYATYNHYSALIAGEFNFALRLFPDGRIETYYGDFEIPAYVMWVSGISKGDKSNYTQNHFSQHLQNPGGKTFEYLPAQLPQHIELTKDGELSISGADADQISHLTSRVKDYNGIVDTKTFQLSSGLIFHSEISSGTDDRIDAFDTASFKYFVKNISNEIIENIELQALIENEKITLLKNGAQFGTLSPGETKAIDSAVVFDVAGSIPDQYGFTVSNHLTSDEKIWQSAIFYSAGSMQLNIIDILVEDGNNNFLEPGETVDLNIEVQNLGHAAGRDLDFKFISNSDYLIVNSASQQIDYIAVGAKAVLQFNVTSRSWTPSGYTIPSVVELSSQGETFQPMSVPITIGSIPVLLLELEDRSNSVGEFQNIFDSLKLQYEYSTKIPANIDKYKSIFVCLGFKFNNYALNWAEGNRLNNYLNNGGNIYMEGMRTWHEDEPTPVHNKFGFEVISDGNYFEFDSVYGVDGKLTEGIKMGYGGSMAFNNYYLQTVDEAYPFLRTSPTDTACAIANETSNYKTIGSSILFGEMTDVDSTFAPAKYVKSILAFFEIEIQVVDVPENSLTVNAIQFEVFPNPFSNCLTLQFSFTDEENKSFEIFDINGRLILHRKLPPNYTKKAVEIHWDGKGTDGKQQSPGIYFIRYNYGKQSVTKKAVMR
ncbi:MAG: hypothetical protein DRI89_01155 [Bacteroidetes bacterium]|nr:MAG: hypothetical protein DRI89_01155 [Bacteroidota bacterium]